MLLGHPPGLRGRADALAEAYAERAREAGWCVAWADLAFDHEVREINPRAQQPAPDLERPRRA